MTIVPDERQTILRIKRPRTAAPADELILEAASPTTKRSKLEDQLRGLTVDHDVNGLQLPGPEPPAARRRRRFVLLTTVTDQAQNEDAAIQQLLSSPGPAAAGGAAATKQAASNTDTSSTPSVRPRYLQVKRQRQEAPPEAASAADQQRAEKPRGLHVYDLEQLPAEGPPQGTAGSSGSTGGLDCAQVATFMSMMEDYYRSQGLPVPDDIAAAKQQAVQGQLPAEAMAAVSGGTRSGSGGAGEDYVWDVYVPMDGVWSRDLESPEGVAVVQVEAEDDLEWWERWEGDGDDEDKAGYETEDSNAESYSGNTYPDEGSSFYDEQDACMRGGGGGSEYGDDRGVDEDGYDHVDRAMKYEDVDNLYGVGAASDSGGDSGSDEGERAVFRGY